MVSRQYRVYDLWNDRVVVAMNSLKQRLALLHFTEQIFAQFLTHGSLRDSIFRPLAAAKLTEVFRQ